MLAVSRLRAEWGGWRQEAIQISAAAPASPLFQGLRCHGSSDAAQPRMTPGHPACFGCTFTVTSVFTPYCRLTRDVGVNVGFLIFPNNSYEAGCVPKEQSGDMGGGGTPHFCCLAAGLRRLRATSLFQGRQQIPAVFVGRRTSVSCSSAAARPNGIPV